MHISEGVLTGPVLLVGAGVAMTGVIIGLKLMDEAHLVKAGILSAAFFVASMIHIPLGPSQVHLVLNGLIGLLLGWAAFPAILVALTLQLIMFQFGGLTTLGVNTSIIAIPAILSHYLFLPLIKKSNRYSGAAAFFSGFMAVLLSTLLLSLSLLAAQESFQMVIRILFISNLPIMMVEGVVTLFVVGFLRKVYPELLFSEPLKITTSQKTKAKEVIHDELL